MRAILLNDAIATLEKLGRQGIRVLTKADLVKVCTHGSTKSFSILLRRLVEKNILQRVARGVYVNLLAGPGTGYLIEEIACVLRRGHFNYVSLESILSEFGVISQIMISRITVMTSGAGGVFETPYGVIEFTHTNRSLESLQSRTVRMERRPLLIATKKAGIADLKRVGRNVNMIDPEELDPL